MSDSLNIIASQQDAGLRADVFVYEHAPVSSRSKASLLFKKQMVLVNNNICKASYRVMPGDVFKVAFFDNDDINYLKPYEIELDILFEDDDLIVVNKCGGLVVHPGAGHISDTLVNALIFHKKKLSSGSIAMRPGIVHRLDKDTSGILLVAKNDKAHINLAKQFENRTIIRYYKAVVYGRMPDKSGSIKTKLARHPGNRKIFRSSSRGKVAITNYEAIQTGEFSLLKIRLETGRTHQIRVHLSEMGNAIVGDKVYGGKIKIKNQTIRTMIDNLSQMALHASHISFRHPTHNTICKFDSDWDGSMKQFIKAAGLDSPS